VSDLLGDDDGDDDDYSPGGGSGGGRRDDSDFSIRKGGGKSRCLQYIKTVIGLATDIGLTCSQGCE
jgi:hypothetical protein